MASVLQEKLKESSSLAAKHPSQAADQLRAIILDASSTDAESVKVKEQAISKLSEVYVSQQNGEAMRDLLTDSRPFFALIPKAKTAKIVRTVIDAFANIPNSTALQVETCKEQVEWSMAEKRTFLRQRIELRLASLYMETRDFQSALTLVAKLLSEVKKLDDKLLLVDIHLLESKVHHALRNLPRSRAALTAARTAANAIYVPLILQAEIDSQSGTLCAEERDYKTAYSYFFEAFEQLSSLEDKKAVQVLKYMLLCKVMLNEVSDVPGIISSKAGLKYTGKDVDAMRAVAKAYQDRSLEDFQQVLKDYKEQLGGDPIVHSHLSELYDTLLEQNLLRLVEPFSRVEIAHVAELIALPLDTVEQKLSQMILDRKFQGTLDQGSGCLEVFDPTKEDKVYPLALDIFKSMGHVVDTLFQRSGKLMA